MLRSRRRQRGSRVERTPVAFVALALVTWAAGCGGNGKTVGEVTWVRPSVRVGSAEAQRGDRLSAKNLLRTSSSGTVHFQLESGTSCNTRRNSSLRIEPGGDIRLEFIAGTSICGKGPNTDDAKFILAPDILISTADPVFAVVARERKSVVHVTFGFVEVETKATRSPVVVGPGQQAVVSSAYPAPRLEKNELGPQDQKVADAMEKRLAKPKPAPPTNLADIAAGGVLVVAVDPFAPASVEAFARRFADLLGAAWSVKSRVEVISKHEAQRRLEEGDVDIVVRPSLRAPSTSAVPLFRREDVTWVMAIPPNTAFEHSLRDFITASLQTGKYGALYVDTFGSQPTYTHAHGGFLVDLPHAALTPTALDFGQVDVGTYETHSVTLTSGSEDLTIGRVRTDSTEYTATKHCPGTLTGGKSCTIDVAFAPGSEGPRSATLTVSRPSGPPLAAKLSGTAVRSTGPELAPAVVDFGQVKVGTRMTRALTLTAGAEDLTIGDIGGGSAEFAATKHCPVTLASGERCEIEVVFAPTAAGATSGTLSIDIGNDQSQHAQLKGVGVVPPTIRPSRLAFGRVAVGDSRRRVIVLSAGSEPLRIIRLRTRTPEEFTARRRCSVQIEPETRCRITVEFKPLEAHSRREVLTISFSDRAPLRVQLIGTGVQALADLDPTSLDFGNVSYNPSASSTRTVTLTNAGLAPLTLIEITSSDRQFSVDSSCSSVAVGESCTFSVTFTPSNGGLQSSVVTVGANGHEQDLRVSGVGVSG